MMVNDLLQNLFNPALLMLLGWIAYSINDISKILAVVVFKTDNHDERITNLEDKSRPGSYRNGG